MPNAPLPGLTHPQSYDTTVPGVVVDRITGLMWQQALANKFFAFDDAQVECAQLTLSGYHDWRLPSRIELVSILDVTRIQPSINIKAFPGTPEDWFWTASVAADNPLSAWYVYFYFGYPKTDDRTNRFSVRCVRTPTPRTAPAARYDIQADAVRDVGTGLTWQRLVPTETLPFDGASAYCSQLALQGKKGWRVPSLGELLTLIDERAAVSPMIDVAAFPNTPSEPFWSSSTFANGPALAWYVFFDNGSGLYGLPTAAHRVRCVL